MLLGIERSFDVRLGQMYMAACVDQPVSGTSWYAHEYGVKGRVEVYLFSLDTAPVLDFEYGLVGLKTLSTRFVGDMEGGWERCVQFKGGFLFDIGVLWRCRNGDADFVRSEVIDETPDPDPEPRREVSHISQCPKGTEDNGSSLLER